MSFLELFLIGIGLSMDAFAISMCRGLKSRNHLLRGALLAGLFFGGFQALNPILGWLLGNQFEKYITAYDHWVAFILLGNLGAKMIWDTYKEKDSPKEECECDDSVDFKTLFVMAIATSIDAFAVGITFSFFQINIALAAVIIGITTFVLSFGGFFLGNKVGLKLKDKASYLGGLVLIGIGIKILVEHLGPFFN